MYINNETGVEQRNKVDSRGDLVGMYFRDIQNQNEKSKLLKREEEIELFKKMHKGDKEARAHLITANLRLVITIAKKFQDRELYAILGRTPTDAEIGEELSLTVDQLNKLRGYVYSEVSLDQPMSNELDSQELYSFIDLVF